MYVKAFCHIISSFLSARGLTLSFLLIFMLPGTAEALFESEKKLVSTRPTLYLDCQQCDYNYIRQELDFVTYVRDPEASDIHLFITVQWVGNGGREYELSYIGRRAFSNMNYTFTHSIDRNMTNSEIRDSLNDAIMLGLAPFMMKTPLAENFRIQYEPLREDQMYVNDVHDPWNNWVFEVYAGRIQLEMESNQRDFQSRWGFFADRVTHDWKIRFRPYFNYSFSEIDQDDGNSAVSHNHRHGIDSYVIKSLGDHWSAGLFLNYLTRNDRNYKHNFRLQPGIEYSLFPYDIATRQSITFRYRIGYTYVDYYDVTIFDKTQEQLLNHRLEARARYQKPWGSINIGVIGSHYFHDRTLRRLQTYSRFSIRLTEGLSLSFQTDFDIVQDQLSLRAGELKLEDILMAQQELATDFSLRGLVAISYTFGSDFANIVNTRF
ncbi:hypothetical protein QLX67_02305 [Balneolaceae bacterium ANBcel3]|nr:hypothetical protein [Balneolaceae bacterium ANBcel3]